MNEFRADLHCHTTCSDGSLSPQEIVQLAKDCGLAGLSITDHDTIDAYALALPEAKKVGIQLLPGVEFSAAHENVSVHILGYAYDVNNSDIRDFCLRHTQRREGRNQAILEQLAIHGMPLTHEEIMASSPKATGSIGRPHIALAMVKKGYIQKPQDAFRQYISEGKPCYVRGDTFSVEETLNTIHQAKGLAIIAHPHLQQNAKTMAALLKMNFDGIECYYARYLPVNNKRWIKLAEKRKWLITGGSDFHGEMKPAIPLGSSWVNEETFRTLLQHFQNHNSR